MDRRILTGIAAAGFTALIWAAYPVATRSSLSGSAAAQDLVFLRFAVGALLFVPFLALRCRGIPAAAWRSGVSLALCQGAGMAALVIVGLQYAPASHAAALGPGASPAWVAFLGLLLFSRRPEPRHAIGAAVTLTGIVALLCAGDADLSASVLVGDAMFLAASALGALYVLQMRASSIGSMHGAAMVAVYSAALVVPWYLLTAPGFLARMGGLEIAWQAAWQGVLIGFVSLVTMNRAIANLGAGRACAVFALVPVLSALFGYLFLAEALSIPESIGILTISLGVALAAAPLRQVRPAPA